MTRVVPAAPRLSAKAELAKAARRRRIAMRVGIGVAAVVPVALLGWLLLSSPLLAVRKVSVTGTTVLTPTQVRAAADVSTGTPLARVDTDAVVRRVRALRPVAQVRVRRGWPGTLRVQVRERTPVAGLIDKTGVTLVDGSGVPYAPANALPPGTVRLQVPTPGATDPTTRAALRVLADLPPNLRTPLRIVRAASPSSVTLVLRDGRQVLWGGVGDTTAKAQAATALLRMPGRIFDVSRPAVVTRR
ncbi:MAG: FtsQ-type POTRA domain-containing protein [Actinobacteria bacterium]|nr:FtsQ-type POTRA domain-containing protein [Actinomycetota bacterium]